MGKTMKSQGIVGLYRGWAVTCAGAFVYRGGQLGLFSQVMAMNPYKDDKVLSVCLLRSVLPLLAEPPLCHSTTLSTLCVVVSCLSLRSLWRIGCTKAGLIASSRS